MNGAGLWARPSKQVSRMVAPMGATMLFLELMAEDLWVSWPGRGWRLVYWAESIGPEQDGTKGDSDEPRDEQRIGE